MLASESPAGPSRALVLDNEFLIATELKALLHSVGYGSVEVAKTPLEAQTLLRVAGFDVAIVEPRLDGPELRRLADDLTRNGTRIVLCTGDLEHEMAKAFPQLPVLPKPFFKADIERCLDAVSPPPAN